MRRRDTSAAELPSMIALMIVSAIAVLTGLAAANTLEDPLAGAITGCIVALLIVASLQTAGMLRGN
jgi:putative Ca2+/H+ antiporter (TMEM165/GDT1 family)